MSQWTNVKGDHNSKKVSIRKLVTSIMGEDSSLLFPSQANGKEFNFCFDTLGIHAAKNLDLICKEFRKLDKNAYLHMDVETIFHA